MFFFKRTATFSLEKRAMQKFAFRDLYNIEENAPFLKPKGACFTLKGL